MILFQFSLQWPHDKYFNMPERRAWSAEEDKILKHLKEDAQISKWSSIAKKMAEEYNMPDRTGKQCRERYHNHLDSTILRTEWTPEEEQHLYKLHDEIGNKWAIIAQKLPGRTDNCVKNHFYSKMRKAIRKLNKIIYQFFKKEIKEIKMTVLYKIVEATDERFKNNPNVEQEVSEKCCKLKNLLLTYSNDSNQIENDVERIGQIARQIHQFSSKYRRKAKKTRRSSAQGPDLLKIPKFEHKVKSSSDCEDDSEYSIVISHECEENDLNDESFSMDEEEPKKSLEQIKEVVDELKESTNSKIEAPMRQVVLITSPMVQVSKPPGLIKPPGLNKPPLIRPPNILSTVSRNIGEVEEGDRVEEFLRIKGLLENEQEGAPTRQGTKIASLADSVRSIEDENRNAVNFLSESIEKMKIMDMNFDVEIDEEHRLFVSN